MRNACVRALAMAKDLLEHLRGLRCQTSDLRVFTEVVRWLHLYI